VLEEFGRPKEKICRFLGPKCFADIEKVYDPRQQCSALSGAYGRFVEDASLLNDSRLVVIIRTEPTFIFPFRMK
jgi:hypothetical protein